MKKSKKILVIAIFGIITTIVSLRLCHHPQIIAAQNEKHPLFSAKEEIAEHIDQTKDYILDKMYETIQNGKITTKKVLNTAKEIQDKIANTSEQIKENIEEKTKNIKAKNAQAKETIKKTITETQKNIKKDLLNAYAEIKKKIVQILKERNTDNIIPNAKSIRDTTHQTCEDIKNKIEIAYNQITEETKNNK